MSTSTVTISIKVVNYLTDKTEIDSRVTINGYEYEVMEANAKAFSEMYPDCGVFFGASNTDFIGLPPLNMTKDEDPGGLFHTDFDAYMAKWYPKAQSQQESDPMTEAMIEAEEDRDFMARLTGFNF